MFSPSPNPKSIPSSSPEVTPKNGSEEEWASANGEGVSICLGEALVDVDVDKDGVDDDVEAKPEASSPIGEPPLLEVLDPALLEDDG